MRKLLFEISEGLLGRAAESTMEAVGCRVKACQTKIGITEPAYAPGHLRLHR